MRGRYTITKFEIILKVFSKIDNVHALWLNLTQIFLNFLDFLPKIKENNSHSSSDNKWSYKINVNESHTHIIIEIENLFKKCDDRKYKKKLNIDIDKL